MSVFHVSPSGSDVAPGTAEAPFRTINRAVEAAHPGDTVRIHEGTYREWVRPVRTGRSEDHRIVFEGAPGEARPVITGAERVTGWENISGTTWRAVVPNGLFGSWNPFAIEVEGDWTVYGERTAPRKHLGEVCLNGMSFYEVTSREAVAAPERRTEEHDRWTGVAERVRRPDRTVYVWYAEVGDLETTIWANFQGADPRVELVEVNVRRSVFYPEVHHVNYITVRGLELCQAATPWAPPTADQPGLVGPNWAKGRVIEDCTLGIWLDWQAQGTRVSRNVMHAVHRGLPRPLPRRPQHPGLRRRPRGPLPGRGLRLQPRARRRGQPADHRAPHPLPPAALDAARRLRGHPHGVEAYLAQVNDPSKGDHERFEGVALPVEIRFNAYGNGAPAYAEETRPVHLGEARVSLERDGDALHLVTRLPQAFVEAALRPVAGRELGRAWYPDQAFENPDGTELHADTDLVGRAKEHVTAYPAGPLAGLAAGESRTRVW